MLGKNFSRQHFEIFFLFSKKIGSDTSCQLSSIGMKSQILFSMKNKKNIINLSSAESAHSVVSVNYTLC